MDYTQLNTDLAAAGFDLSSNTNDVQIAADFSALESATPKSRVITGRDLIENFPADANDMVKAMKELAADPDQPIAESLLQTLVVGSGQDVASPGVQAQIAELVTLTAAQTTPFTQAHADAILGLATEMEPAYYSITANDVAIVRRRFHGA